ncbi:PREDICTED: RNA-directed DNA polymerase from mobile element jockey-like [Trachymyrmex cornetzi]|uniref:RNA-directed DNA polymerase from mobile element jockey-like n=1 Tax=Trachymyrmex cornetzi TaxID=471704 RepID=UPI00084EE4BC|nr:PREDICTED: RNA-directed DNA polymerase from mobile element jockey-like [Trachymyrmex cornetzi]
MPIRKDITHPGDRDLCTLVRADIKSELVVLQNTEHPSVEFNVVRIECLTSEPVIIVNVYRHPGQRTPASFFRSLLNSLQGYKNLIILGDLNAHHPAWGSRTYSNSGRTLHQIIGEYDMFILNDKAPTFVRTSSAATSTIDLVLASPSLAPLCSTKTNSDTLGSDHFPVITTIGIQACFKKKFYYKIPVSKEMCQDLFRILLSTTKDLPAQVGDDLLGRYDAFTNNILEAARSFLPESKRLPRTSVQIKKLADLIPPWWNEICSKAVRDRKKAIREFLSAPSEENHQEFRRARLNCARVLLEQKRRGWRNLVNGFNARTPTSQIWALIKSFKRRASQQDSPQQEHTRIALEAISKLCPPSSFCNRSKTLTDMKSEDEKNTSTHTGLDDPLTMSEYRRAKISSRKNSAPRLDQICYEMLDQLPMEHETYLLSMFNEIFSRGTFPD